MASQVTKVKDRFGITRVVLVGDRGMLTAASRRADRPWRCYRPDHSAGNTAGKWVPLVLCLGLEFFLLEFSFG